MQNLLLRHCREQSRLTGQKIATRTGIPLSRYRALEATEALLGKMESEQLGKLFNIDPYYLWQYAMQLESLKVAQELVQLQKEKIRTLQLTA